MFANALNLSASAVLMLVLTAAPALADEPQSLSTTISFTDTNPCTGDTEQVTINFEIFVHEHHGDRIVARAVRTGTTSGGYVAEHGRETFVDNGNTIVITTTEIWRNDAGSAYRVKEVIVFNANDEELLVDRFELRCLDR